jgi:mannose-6-phosphate isomerase-like protein (cupin superfamily)
MQFLEISWDFGILGFSKIWGFFQRFFRDFWWIIYPSTRQNASIFHVSPGIKLKWIIHQFTSDFLWVFLLGQGNYWQAEFKYKK